MRLSPLLVVLVLLLPACSLFETTDETVRASLVGDAVLIVNDTDERRYYFVIGTESEKLTDWAPHAAIEHSVAPGETRLVPEHHIVASDDEPTLNVHTWRIEPPVGLQLQTADWQTVTLQR